MAVKAEDFLIIADLICKANDDEIHIRTAISRCYYSMYHKALSLLQSTPFKYPNMGCHASLVRYLLEDAARNERHSPLKLKRLSYMLQQEKDKRVHADYELDHPLTIGHANESLKTAKRFYALCEQKDCNETLAS